MIQDIQVPRYIHMMSFYIRGVRVFHKRFLINLSPALLLKQVCPLPPPLQTKMILLSQLSQVLSSRFATRTSVSHPPTPANQLPVVSGQAVLLPGELVNIQENHQDFHQENHQKDHLQNHQQNFCQEKWASNLLLPSRFPQ